jgi:hypothetical protein
MSSLFATYLAINISSLIMAVVCVVCLVLIIRSRILPAQAVWLGAAGFGCLLLEALLSIGVQVAAVTMRNALASDRQLGLLFAASGLFKLVLYVVGLAAIARAVFAGRDNVENARR